jgi:hypothetical protein
MPPLQAELQDSLQGRFKVPCSSCGDFPALNIELQADHQPTNILARTSFGK